MASSIFLLVELAIIVTPSAALYILGVEHLMIEDKKIWSEDPPSFLEFTGPILSVKALIGNRGYNLGPHLEHSPARPELRVIEPNYKPTIQNTFTDMFGNVLECNDGRALFVFKTTNQRYPVITGNSSFIIRCIGDYKRNRAFLIAGSRRISTMGKLYALDTKEAEVVDGEVITEEITEAGDLISAVAIRPSNGVILLSREEMVYNLKSFLLVYLHPVHLKFLSTNKLTKQQVTRANEFDNEVTKGGEKLLEILRQFWNRRTSRLIYENRRLRGLAETLTKADGVGRKGLPGVGKLLNPAMSDKDFKEIVENFKYHSARLYKKYVLESKVAEEYRCRKILTRLRTKVAHYFGKFNVKEETLVINASTLGLAKRVDSTTRGRVRVLTLDYKINVTNTYTSEESPSYIFPKESSGVLRILIGGGIYNLGRDFGPMDYEKPYDGFPTIPENFTDRFGHKLLCGDGRVFFKDQKRCPIAMCPVVTGQSYFPEYCILDYERNRAFIISSEKVDAAKGGLFVFDTENIVMNGTLIYAEQIKELGDNVTAVSVDSVTGDIYLTEEVISSNRKVFNMVVLKPKAPTIVLSRTIQHRQSLIRPSTDYIDGNEFIKVLKENVTELVHFHEKNWLEQMQELIYEQNGLKDFLQRLVSDPHKNISSFLLSEIARALRDSWGQKFREAVNESQSDTVRVYEEHLLSGETWESLEASRKCLVLLSDLEAEGQGLLSNIIAHDTSKILPPQPTTPCPKTWPLSC